MSALILRSDSDSVVDGAVRLGVHADFVEPARARKHALRLRVLRATDVLRQTVGPRALFLILRCDDREICRTTAQYSTSNTMWVCGGFAAKFEICLQGSDRSENVLVEAWISGLSTARRCYAGRVILTAKQLVDRDLQNREWLFLLSRGGRDPPGGKVILTWVMDHSAGGRAHTPKSIELRESRTELPDRVDELSNANDILEFPYLIRVMTDLRVAPGLEDQRLCISASLGTESITSDARQPHPECKLAAPAACWRGATVEQLHLQVGAHLHGGRDFRYGRCSVPLPAHWRDDGVRHHVLLPLSAPAAQDGHVITIVQIERRLPFHAESTIATLAEEERARVLRALERSAARAKYAARNAGYAVERATSSSERATLRNYHHTYRREAAHASTRVDEAREAEGIWRQRAFARLEAAGISTEKTDCLPGLPHQRVDCPDLPSSKRVLPRRINEVKERELKYVSLSVTLNPASALGIIWGEMPLEEASALAAGRAGFSTAMSTTPHTRALAAAVQPRTALHASNTKPLAAGRDMVVVGVRRNSQAATAGRDLVIGARATFVNGIPLGCRETLRDILEHQIERSLTFTFIHRVHKRERKNRRDESIPDAFLDKLKNDGARLESNRDRARLRRKVEAFLLALPAPKAKKVLSGWKPTATLQNDPKVPHQLAGDSGLDCLPDLPVLESSIYLTVLHGCDLELGGLAPHVRVLWCTKEVARTWNGVLDADGQPHWKKDSFLLPLPQNDEERSVMVKGTAEDSVLRLELWTTGRLRGRCHGHVLLEGSDLLRQCYKENDGRARRATRFRLANGSDGSSLAVVLRLIHPAKSQEEPAGDSPPTPSREMSVGNNARSSLVYRLQVLYGTHIRGECGICNPYVVVICDGRELARSAVTPNSSMPLFRNQRMSLSGGDVFSVDIPNEVAFASADRPNTSEVVIHVADHQRGGGDRFSGEVRLQSLDLSLATGRRLVKALKPRHADRQEANSYFGGDLHVAGHITAGQPHFTVHILEAHELTTFPGATPRLASGSARAIEVNSFAICYWGKEEVGRTIIKHKTKRPSWQELSVGNNGFRIPLDPTDIDSTVGSPPALRVEIYNTVNAGTCARRGGFLGQATLRGPEELRPTSLDDVDCHTLVLFSKGQLDATSDQPPPRLETNGSYVKVRLLLKDDVPVVRDWLRTGTDPKGPSPNLLDVFVIGASNLTGGNIFLRVWFNGRLVSRVSSFFSDVESKLDADARAAGGCFPLALGTRPSTFDCLLVEFWKSSESKQDSRPDKAREVFLGESRVSGGVLRSPPSHRIDLPLRAKGTPASTGSDIIGSCCLHLSPQAKLLGRDHIRRRQLVRPLARAGWFVANTTVRTPCQNGMVPQKLMSLRLSLARNISQNVTGATGMEVVYNRRRIALVNAIDVTKEPNEDYTSIVWNSSIEFPAEESPVPGHRLVWPELRLALNHSKSNFLGEAVLAGDASILALCAGQHLVLPLGPRRDVPGDLGTRITGNIALFLNSVTEQKFSDEVARWGVTSFPCKMLAAQIPGSRGGEHAGEASAAISWGGEHVGRTDLRPADQARHRDWSDADFLLPADMHSDSRALRVSVQARAAHLGHVHIALGNLGQLPPFCARHTLEGNGDPPNGDPPSSCTEPIHMSPRVRPVDCTHRQGRGVGLIAVRRRHDDSDPKQLGSILVRLCQQEAEQPSATPPAATDSCARLRITILGTSKLSKRRSCFVVVVCYRRKGDVKPAEMPVSIPDRSGQTTRLVPIVEEVLVWLPSSWATDWARGHGALWIELRQANELLGIAFSGPAVLTKLPRLLSRTEVSYLELRNRASSNFIQSSVADSTFSKRLMQPSHTNKKYDYVIRFPPFLVRRAQLHHRVVLEEVHRTKGTGHTAEWRPGSVPLESALSRRSRDNRISRLRLLILGQTRSSHYGVTEENGPIEISVNWCGKPVDCEAPLVSPPGSDVAFYLLPFGRGVPGAERDGDVLLLHVGSERARAPAARPRSLALCWNDFRRLPSVQTDYNVDPPDGRSPFDLCRLVSTPPIEFEVPETCSTSQLMALVHGRRGTLISRARTGSVTLHLVMEESCVSTSHALSAQIRGLAFLQDRLDLGTAGRARWLGSIQRWPYVSIFGPGLRASFARSGAVKEVTSGSSPWAKSDLDFRRVLQLPPATIRWPASATTPSFSTDIIVADFGEHCPEERWSSVQIQAWYRRRTRSRAHLAKMVPSSMMVQRAWRAHRRWYFSRKTDSHASVAAVAALQRAWRQFRRRYTSNARPPKVTCRGGVPTRIEGEQRPPKVTCRRHPLLLSVLGCDEISNAAQTDPYVAVTLDGLEVNNTRTRRRTLRPRWHDHRCILDPDERLDYQKVRSNHSALHDLETRGRRRGALHSALILFPEDRARLLHAALAVASRYFSVHTSETLARALGNVYLVARLGDRALCVDVIPTDVNFRCGQAVYANFTMLRNCGGVLELEVWGRKNSFNACIVRGEGHLPERMTLPWTLVIPMRPRKSLCLDSKMPKRSNLFLGFMSTSVAISATCARDLENSGTSFVPVRPPPERFVQLVGFEIKRKLAKSSDSLRQARQPLYDSLDLCVTFTLGLCSQRLSHLSHGGTSTIWPPTEVVTLTSWHSPTELVLQIDMLRDRAPCPDDLLGTQQISLSSCSNQWQYINVEFSLHGDAFDAALCFWITQTTIAIPAPHKLYSGCPRAPVAPRSLTKENFDVETKFAKQSAGDLKIYNVFAKSLPEAVRWGAACGHQWKPFVFVEVCGQCARTRTRHGKGANCAWEGEVLALSLSEQPPDAQLTVQLWNDRSPGKDVLIGEARVPLGVCLTTSGTEQTFELDIARPPARKDALPRSQGVLSICIATGHAPEFLNDVDEKDELNPLNELRVVVIQARDIPSTNKSDGQTRSSAPWVVLTCEGEREASSVKYKSSCPVWNELYSMQICADRAGDAPGHDLIATLYDWCASGSSVIGQVRIPLASLHDGVIKRKWYRLHGDSRCEPIPGLSLSEDAIFDLKKRRREPRASTSRGELELALQWRYNGALDYFKTHEEPDDQTLPPNELLVALIRARGLCAIERGYYGSPLADPFAKLRLDRERRQSRVVHRTLDPAWNETYRISLRESLDPALEVMIFDWNLGCATDALGSASIHLSQLHSRVVLRRWHALSQPSTLGIEAKREAYKPEDCDDSPRGEVELALRWVHNPKLVPYAGRVGIAPNCLKVTIVSARRLYARDFRGTSNPSAVLSLHARQNSTSHHRTARTTTRAENATREPRWSEVFSLPCMVREAAASGNLTNSKELDLDLYVEIEDHTYLGASGAFGAARIDFRPSDTRPRRLWAPLDASSKALVGQRVGESRGEMELLLQLTHVVIAEPQVIVRVPWLRVTLVSPLVYAAFRAYLRLKIGGCVVSTAAVRIAAHEAAIIWKDSLTFATTVRALLEKSMEVCLFLQTTFPGGARDILAGRARFLWPHVSAIFPREMCIQSTLWHGNMSRPVSHLSFLMNTIEWSPDMANAVTRARHPRVCLDVFTYKQDTPGEHLGRSVLSLSQTPGLTAVSSWVETKQFETPSKGFSLQFWSARRTQAAAGMLGTIFIALTAARSLNLSSTSESPCFNFRNAQEDTVDRSDASCKSLDIAKDMVYVLIETAWKYALSGRHSILHVVDATDLCACHHKDMSPPTSAGSAQIDPGRSPRIPDAYCVVQRNDIEIGRTLVCPRQRSPSWHASVPLAPEQADNSSMLSAVVVDVYDDGFDHENEGGTSFLGRVALSHTQVWELRQATRRRLKLHRTISLQKQLPRVTAKVDYRLSRKKTEFLNVGSADTNRTMSKVALSMTHAAAAELPGTTLSSRLFGRLMHLRRTPYILLRLPGSEARSSTTTVTGSRALWKHERISIDVDESLLADEPLLVQIWGKRAAPLSDYLIGEGHIRLDALLRSRGKAMPIALELGRPGHRQQGIISGSLSLERQEKSIHAPGAPSEPASSRARTGALGLAVTIDEDAEAASTLGYSTEYMQQGQGRETIGIAAMSEAITQLDERFGVSELDDADVLIDADNESNAASLTARLRLRDEDLFSGGVDASTGLLWRKDHYGYRRMLLGYDKSAGK